MKILIAADMEGITGVTNWDQTDPQHSEYARFCKLMTGDVNAAVQGAFEAGADEVVVTDGHADGYNILIEELDPRARLNSGNSAPYSMIQGIDENVQGVMFVGYHARAGSMHAVLDHTWSGAVTNLWLNDTLVGEYGLNAALSGYYNVPVIMISGDQTACLQAMELLGPIEVATVKRASGRMSADCLPPVLSKEKICEAAARAVQRLQEGDAPAPYRVSEPVRVAVEFINSSRAENASVFPGSTRNGRKVEIQVSDMDTAYFAFRSLVSLSRE